MSEEDSVDVVVVVVVVGVVVVVVADAVDVAQLLKVSVLDASAVTCEVLQAPPRPRTRSESPKGSKLLKNSLGFCSSVD